MKKAMAFLGGIALAATLLIPGTTAPAGSDVAYMVRDSVPMSVAYMVRDGFEGDAYAYMVRDGFEGDALAYMVRDGFEGDALAYMVRDSAVAYMVRDGLNEPEVVLG